MAWTNKRIRLRKLEEQDSDRFYSWITNKELVLLNAPFRFVSRSEHERWFSGALEGDSSSKIFAIEVIETGSLIGSCQLSNIHSIHRNAELQIRIGDSNQRGKGLGSEAVRNLCAFGFGEMNLHRIYLHVFATNIAAINAYMKCGFVHEGTLREAARIENEWVDVHVMGLIRNEFV